MGANVDELAEPLRTSVVGLLAEANAGGMRVWVTSARRTQEEQIGLRRKNCGTTDYDIWQKPSGECSPETAIPGRSRHETGQAVDFGGDFSLVAKLAPKYQLVKTVPKEAWHYEHATTAGGPIAPDGTNQGFLGGGVSDASAGDLAGGLASKVPGAGAIKDVASAAVAVARALTDPSTWMRVVGVVAGTGFVTIGLVVIARDLGAPVPGPSTLAKATPAGAARAAKTTPARAAGAANPATPLT